MASSVQTVTFVRPADTVMVQLESAEGDIFTVPEDVANKLITIKNVLADMEAEDGFYPAIPLPNIKSLTLDQTIKYLFLEETNPAPESVQLTEWQNAYCEEIALEQRFQVILAANYLDNKALLGMLCKNIANMLKGKTPAEIRASFGVDREFTAEEKAQVMKDNPWLMDDEPTTQ